MLPVLKRYIDWHYFDAWPKILLSWRNLTLFPFYYFSIPLHLSTLLAPWKRQRVKMRIGFHLDDLLSVMAFNSISRIIGCFIRLSTILSGLFLMLVFFLLGLTVSFLWPIIPGISIIFYIGKNASMAEETTDLLRKSNGNLNKLANLLFSTREGQFIACHLGFNPKYLLGVFRSYQSTKMPDSYQDNPSSNSSQLNNATSTAFHKFKHTEQPREINGKSKEQSNNTSLPDLFQTLAKTYSPFKNLLQRYGFDSEDVHQTAIWAEDLSGKKGNPLLSDLDRIKKIPGIGTQWSYGYTVAFDLFATDMTKNTTSFPILVGRENELETLQQLLSKTENNNALVVGEPGVARHRLVETLAHYIQSGLCLATLSHKRILSLNMHAMISSASSIQDAKGLIAGIFDEASFAGNVIVVIDDFDKYVSTGEGRIDLSDIITKYKESSLRFIGITTPSAFHKYIEPNSEISSIFEKVEIDPPDIETVLIEMEISIAPVLEKKYGITITYPAIKKAIDDSDRYISTTPFPAKTIELLDQSIIFINSNKSKNTLTASDIDEFLSEKYHISIGNIQMAEKEKLARLESLLHQQVINQNEAINAISSALRRARLDVSNREKPVGSFLFLGPTGVGKTETAKALSRVYFGSQEAMLRFDMSQYQKEEGLERLIGSVKLGSPGELCSQLSDHPFSLLLLDEFEKSDKEIYNLFLSLLDEGYVTDATGKKINAKNTIIIATSNAGGEFIREKVKEGVKDEKLKTAILEYVQQERIFSPELLNRFDATVVFTPLSEGHLREIARLQLEALNKRLAPKEITVDITPEIIRKLATAGFDPEFGARAMKRVIAERIEDEVAQKLLQGEVQKGEKITINL